MNYLIKQWLGYKITSDDVKKELENHLKYSKQDPKPLIDLWNKLLEEEKNIKVK